jgi:uncharacterized protein (TIGR03089 family)
VHQLGTLEAHFDELVRHEPSRPFVTYYDEATGERAELSVKSLANWVAKTHHLLTTELGMGVGDTAYVELPCHWLSVPVLLGVLSAGLHLSSAAAAADVAFLTQPDTDVAAAYVVSATPTGTPDDYIGAVRPQADAWGTVHAPGAPGDPGLDALSRGDLVARAVDRASVLGIEHGSRVLSTRSWTSPDAWVDTLFAPLVMAGSVVYAMNCADEAVLDKRAAQERVSVRVS